ncbi:hypothetical protein [Flavobacterium sp.]|uniref:hypothetical protein n=1 Tax=Flavobacterium sp. TaxID=239 RepID=UPI00263386E2|nr:hypothetical protein [Flavobacterium sp.]
MKLNELIEIAGILIGFQLTIFTFRISRELTLKRKKRWFPLPDFINLLSVFITVLFLFLYPLKNIETYDIRLCQKFFGFSVLLFVIYPFALIGHYEMFSKASKRSFKQKYITKQETFVLIIGGIISILYFLL